MRNARLLLLVPALLLFAAGRSDASILFTANLNNASENPPTVPMTSGGQARPASFGTAMFEMDDAMTFMSFTATIFNIDVTGTQTPDVNDNLGNAHIHASATRHADDQRTCRVGVLRQSLQRQQSEQRCGDSLY